MRGMQPIDAFDLDEQSLIDQQIDPERSFEAKPLKLDANRLLTRYLVAHLGELGGQDRLVH